MGSGGQWTQFDVLLGGRGGGVKGGFGQFLTFHKGSWRLLLRWTYHGENSELQTRNAVTAGVAPFTRLRVARVH